MIKCIAITLITLTITLSTFGAGMRVGFMDSFASTRGNAFAATADTPAAIFYNPGGLTQLEGDHASAGVYLIRFESEYTTPDGSETHSMRDRFVPVPHLYFGVRDEESPVAFGVGAYMPFGLITDWPDDAPFATEATRSELTYLRLNPVVAWTPAAGLSIGGGPTLNIGDAELRRNIFLQPDPSQPTLLIPGDYRVTGTDSSVGFNAGVHWNPHPQHAFGFSYHHHTQMEFTGTDRARTPLGSDGGHASVELPFPEIVIAGYSFRPTPEWNLEVNVDWTRWSRLDSTTIRSETFGDEELDFNWRSTFFYGAGVTRYLPNDYHINAGYVQTENAVPSASFWPGVPDSRFHFFSAGFGRQVDWLSWHLGYHYGHASDRDISASPEEGGGNYDNQVHGAFFTVSATY